jgi:hypothetical protein
MKQKVQISICLILLIMFVSIITARDTHATVRLFDSKVILNGYVKEVAFYRTAMKDRDKKYHDTSLDFLKTSAGIEALYKIKETEDYTLEFFTGMKWWYEAALHIDDELRRAVPSDARYDYMRPQNFDDDVLNEAYLDFIKGPFQVRVGKQIVVWGNLDIDRAADVVNAVDFRHSIFGIDKWEEFKRGATMIRMFYQSEFPGNLRFEVIVNPGDFKRNLFPFTEGLHYGPDAWELDKSQKNPAFNNEPYYGYGGYVGAKIEEDAPGWNRKNYELGFRVSGYTWNWDWSLLFYDRINKDPVVDPNTVEDWAGNYFNYALGGYGPNWNQAQHIDPWLKGPEVFKFKRNQIVGGTLERELLSGGYLFRGAILTFEWFYEIGKPLNKTTDGYTSDGEPESGDKQYVDAMVRRDIMGGAVKLYQKINIPGFTNSFIATGKQFEFTLTYWTEKVMNHDNELVLDRTHEWDQSVANSISFFAIQQMFNFSWTFVFNSFYKPRIDKWFVAPAVRYMFPGSQFYVEGGYIMYGGAKNKYHTSRVSESKDSIMLKLVYEF